MGTQEVTRFGMGEKAMAEIAGLIGRVMIHKEEPEKVRPAVIAFRKVYQTLHFVR
jgi:glycine hydroxymethyltransferase